MYKLEIQNQSWTLGMIKELLNFYKFINNQIQCDLELHNHIREKILKELVNFL